MQMPTLGCPDETETDGNTYHLRLHITPGRVFRLLVLANLILIFLNIVGQECKYLLGHEFLKGFVPMFDLDDECNIPTSYEGLQLLAVAALAGVVSLIKYRRKDKYTHHWQAMAIIFVYLAFDETSYIHEYLISPTRELLMLDTGPFAYAWVVVAIPVLVFLTFAYWKFMMALPRFFLALFVLSAVVFLGGAVGMEMVGAHFDTLHGGQDNLRYSFLTTTEESMEMFGVSIFIYTLLLYIRSLSGEVRFDIDLHDKPAKDAAAS